jgi:Uma2 family endonuclease
MIGAVAIEQRLVTADELLAMPDDGFKYELRKGELIRMPPPGVDHGDYGNNINVPLWNYVRTRRLGKVFGEVGFKLALDPDTVRAPDVSFISRERLTPGRRYPGYWEGAPDLAVEVVSPNDSAQGLRDKIAEYLAAGTRLIWVVYPRTRTVTVYRANGTLEERSVGQTLDGEDVVPGFSLSVADVFDTEL